MAEETNEEKKILDFDNQTLLYYLNNEIIISTIKEYFTRISTTNAKIILREILFPARPITLKLLKGGVDTFYKTNAKFFEKYEDTYILKEESREELMLKLDSMIKNIHGSIKEYESQFKDNEIMMQLSKFIFYEKIRMEICDQEITQFKYDFKNPDLETQPPSNIQTLQRCNIHIVSPAVKFHYPIKYKYHCPECNTNNEKLSNEVMSTNLKIKCSGRITTLNGNERVCGTPLIPDYDVSLTTDAFYYDVNYEDEEGRKHSVSAISFLNVKPGFYDAVLFNVRNNKKTEMFHIMDVNDIKSNKFSAPEPKDKEHYIITLTKAFDKYIKQKSGVDIFGLYPIKFALIIQKLFSIFGFKLSGNIQLVGDPSTGKSLILKYYGFLLNNSFNMTTNGLSVSIPGLRGTRNTISLMGKDIKVVTVGHLGTYISIHIDEAGENKELVKNLKSFLLDDNYSYDKAGGVGVTNKRTAHVNISENLDHAHVGQYRGLIRKTYKDINFKIGDEEKEEWNEKWDLHLPLFRYNNPYLRKVIKEKRLEYMQKQTFWIDGYEYALHERFPFYYYLVSDRRDNIKLSQTIRDNLSRNTISENLELMRALHSDDIRDFFNKLKEQEINTQHDSEAFMKVDDIIDSYGFDMDTRMKSFYYQLIKTLRLLCKRDDYTQQDFDILQYFLEQTNRKIDVADTDVISIDGPPDLKYEEAIDQKIEDETTGEDSDFGLQDGEFDDV